MNDLVYILALVVIIIFQTVERYLYIKDMTNKLNDSIKAIMSRNINDYIAATQQPKNVSTEPKEELVDLSDADEKTFDSALKKM